MVLAAWLPLLAAIGCGDDAPKGKAPPAPKNLAHQRLHAPGEVRLTSAGAEPRVRLRYRLEPGQYQGFRTSVSVKHRAAGQTSSLTAVLDWERRVTGVSAGWAQAEVSVRKVRLARPASIREDVVRRLMAMSLRFAIDARGRARATARGAATARTRATARGAARGTGLAAPMTNGILEILTAPLPADAVGHGATWERYEPVTLTLPKTNLKVRLGVRTRYTLALIKRGGRERYAQITSRIQLTAHSPGPTPGASRAAWAAGPRVTGGGQGTGEIKIDLNHATVVSAKSDITLDLSLIEKSRTRTLKQTTTTSTRAINLRPRPRRPRPRPTGSTPHPYPTPPRPAAPG